VLKGAGAALALPFLEAMVPARTTLAQSKAAAPPPRFVGLFVPHGGAPGYWVPEKVGALPETLPHNWKYLEPFRDKTVIFSGLHSRSAEPPPGVTGADHWVAAAFMCADKPKKTAGADVRAGTTIDQIIARRSAATVSSRRCRWPSRTPAPTPATAARATAASTRTPSRGPRRPHRCRWS
jgi:hypothetical protein